MASWPGKAMHLVMLTQVCIKEMTRKCNRRLVVPI
jgi:hypothetical protein